jgi:hypothetical protein
MVKKYLTCFDRLPLFSICVFRTTLTVKAIISLNGVNRLIFVTLKRGVFFAVRTEFLRII